MLIQSGRQLFKASYWQLHLAVAGGVGLLLGASALWLSPQMTIVVLAIVGVTLAALKRPEIALLGILTATSSILFEERLPLIPIGIGSLHIPDLILLALFGLILIRWLVEKDFKIIRTPLDLPLLAFYGIALLSTFIAVLQSSVEIEEARRAIRIVTYYLTFFVVTNLVRDDRQLRFLLNGLFFLAMIVAGAMIAQFLVGESLPILPGRVETLWTQSTEYRGIARIIPPGQSLILIAFIGVSVTLALYKSGSIKVLKYLQWILLGSALILTFNRSYWATTILAMLLLSYILRDQERQRLIWLFMISLVLLVILLLFTSGNPELRVSNLMDAFITRLATLGDSETITESSLQWRYVENEYALSQIVSKPLLGLGLGARYRPFDSRIDYPGANWDARYYIHNGHLWILVKTGFLGYLCLVWLSLTFLLRGFKNWRLSPMSQMGGTILGFTLAYVAVLIASVTSPMLMEWFWIPVIGLMMGVNEAALMIDVNSS